MPKELPAPQEPNWKCPVCDAPKFSFEDMCRDCLSAERRTVENARAEKRYRRFGFRF